MRPIFKILLLILLLLSCAGGYLIFLHYHPSNTNADVETQPLEVAALTHPPDLQMLAMHMQQQAKQAIAEQSAEQNLGELDEQQQIEAEQIGVANQQLFDTDPEQRKIAVEQLAAYLTLESEKLLQGALQGDVSPEVRAAAAKSLGYVKQPTRETLSILLEALQDDEDVSQNAFDALNKFLLQLPADSAPFRKLAIELKTALHKEMLPQSVRDNLENLLEEQHIR